MLYEYECWFSYAHEYLYEYVLLQEVKDLYTAVVKMLDTGDKLKVDQEHLETVIPAIGTPHHG